MVGVRVTMVESKESFGTSATESCATGIAGSALTLLVDVFSRRSARAGELP